MGLFEGFYLVTVFPKVKFATLISYFANPRSMSFVGFPLAFEAVKFFADVKHFDAITVTLSFQKFAPILVSSIFLSIFLVPSENPKACNVTVFKLTRVLITVSEK